MVIKIIQNMGGFFFLDKQKIKRWGTFQKWTFLKMSKIQKSQKDFQKHLNFHTCEHNALIFEKC